MISHFVMLLLAITNASCVPDMPRSVKFSSKNMMTLLVWEPATGTSSATQYQVEYKLYGAQKWKRNKECWDIAMAQCDLTMDVEHTTNWMCGRVRAVSHSTTSDWVAAQMSSPQMDMTFDPPTFEVVPETNSLQVHIRPSFENSTHVKKVEYEISVKETGNGSILSTKRTAHPTERMGDLASGKEYCVSVSSVVWMSHIHHKSAARESCHSTETEQGHLQLIAHLALGLSVPLMLLFTLFLFARAFRSIYRPPARLPVNLIFTVEEWKTLHSKPYADVKQHDDDFVEDVFAGDWIRSKAKTNRYVKIPQSTPLSVLPIVNHAHEPLTGFSRPPPLLEDVCHVQGYAPQLSCPGSQADESYGEVHHGPGFTGTHALHDNLLNVNQLTFSSAGNWQHTGLKS
ncbi:hypothetical protein AAFF_G00149610 [Aldrovandia affinis]|uniref:Uncharacterized protein n=1 Tax=Aldrovandia affinis TaxID=143900 RepID=A0AAD7RPC1_9TELE|nr:hypothetical protein AAFF_G00149610 [Aldrovandia affinis]